VQRVADELVRDGLAVYHENPRHQRAKLLAITSVGSLTLEQIEAAQRAWSNKLGQRIGLTTLQRPERLVHRCWRASNTTPTRLTREQEILDADLGRASRRSVAASQRRSVAPKVGALCPAQ
jgi:DNA-binding MarR family transcriptional regulator